VADINNRIGLDASGAITALGNLTTALNSANVALTNLQNNSGSSLTANLQAAGNAAQTAASQTQAVGTGTRAAASAAGELAVSWQTVSRVIQTQFLIRGINELRDAFFESADAAAEFQLTIGRINAIADQSETNFDDLSARVKALSVAIGRDLGETSAAVFEALQNDLGSTDETFALLEDQAAKLAVVTGGTLDDAVSALSSVIKIYGENSEDAANASGVLFGAINAGRVTLQELQGSLGTVIPLAQRVGVSFEQAASAIATISLAGVDAATAQTQLRNVFNRLIKPTEELTRAFRGLRVQGFDELIERTNGDFTQALQLIADELGNDERALAKAFNTIRGNLGVFNILSQDGEVAANTLKTVQESALGLTAEFEKIDQLDARVAERNAARLGVIFEEVGEDALKLRNAAISAFLTIIDDSDSARAALLSLGGAVTIATGALVGFRLAGVGAGSAALLGFAGPLALVTAGVVAFAGAALVTQLAINKMEEAARGFDDATQFDLDRLDRVVDITREVGDERLEELRAALNDASTGMNTLLRESQTTASGIVGAFAGTEGTLRRLGTNIVEGFAESRERILDQIRDGIKGLDDEIEQGTRDLARATENLADFDFKQSIDGLSQIEKSAAALSRSFQSTAEAARLAVESGLSEESVLIAKAAIDTARSQAQFALSTAQATGNARDIASAQAQVRAVLQSEENLLRRQLTIRKDINRTTLEEQLAAIENVNESQKDAIREQVDSYNDLTRQVADGVPREALAEQFQEIRDNLEKIGEDLPDFSGSDLVKRFGLTNLARSVEQETLEALNNLDVRWNTSIASLKDQLLSETFEATVQFNTRLDAAALSEELRAAFDAIETDDPTVGLAERSRIFKEAAESQQRSANEIEVAGAEFNKNAALAAAEFRKAGETKLFGTPQQEANAQALVQPSIEALNSVGTASAESLQRYRDGFAQLSEFLKSDEATGGLQEATRLQLISGVDAAIGAIRERFQVLGQQQLFSEQQINSVEIIKSLGEEPIAVELDTDDSGVREAKRQLDLTGRSAESAAQSTSKIGTNATNTNSSVGSLASTTNSLAGAALSAEAAFRRMETAARDAAAAASAASAGSGSGNAFHGGVQFRNAGGNSRGQDTIPMMLAPGEFVSNQRATANFLPELQAINAGNAPSTGQSSSTNITIGDINVNSQSQLPSQTAREVGNSIKRELRRGTFKL